MSEAIGRQEFSLQLPRSVEFEQVAHMAILAADLAQETRAQLDTQVAAKNQELAAEGTIGKDVCLITHELYVRRSTGELNYFAWDGRGKPLQWQVSGKFKGLTVLDTTQLRYSSGQAGRYLAHRNGEEPDRLVVCGLFSSNSDPDGGRMVPLARLDGVPEIPSLASLHDRLDSVQASQPD